MFNEKQTLEKACDDLEAVLRRAALLALQAVQQEQKKTEAAAWQSAWFKWNAAILDNDLQVFEAGGSASERPG